VRRCSGRPRVETQWVIDEMRKGYLCCFPYSGLNRIPLVGHLCNCFLRSDEKRGNCTLFFFWYRVPHLVYLSDEKRVHCISLRSDEKRGNCMLFFFNFSTGSTPGYLQ
jgi:hypothetical protein